MAGFTRRDVLGSAALIGGWYALSGDQVFAQERSAAGGSSGGTASGPYSLPPLPYDYTDLETHIDAQTMKLHHDVHHAGYVRNANAAIAELAHIRRIGGEQITRVRAATDKLSFNLAGHLLHAVFWPNMAREGGGNPEPGSEIGRMIKRDFGSLDAFRGHFQAAAQQVQGSGWGILAFEPTARRLVVLQAEKHQNAAVWGAVPLLVVDVWEHAYYLKYQNKRSSYIKAFMNVINWNNVDQRLRAVMEAESLQ
ncbi:MAG: superoxide dismutase [Phycisphaerae bacterium]